MGIFEVNPGPALPDPKIPTVEDRGFELDQNFAETTFGFGKIGIF